MTGDSDHEDIIITRTTMQPKISGGIVVNREQFPVRLCFSMSINKAQGQTLEKVGVHLRTNPFAPGQFYVACSRVSSGNNLFILAPSKTTNNVVYQRAFSQNKGNRLGQPVLEILLKSQRKSQKH